MDYREAASFLFGLRRFRMKPGTTSTEELLSELGDPHEGGRFVQITGSNGKGSTARMTESILREAGLDVVTSASIAQGDLTGGLPEAVARELKGDTPAQQAINFARSAPGVTSTLVGASDTDHVAENVAAGTHDPMGAEAFDAVFE
jgi:hypothetical protein